MTTVPETAVAGGLITGGVLLAVALFTIDTASLKKYFAPTPQQTTLTCPNGNVLALAERLCHPIPFGPVDLHLDTGDAFTIPARETGVLKVISGAITIDDGRPFFRPDVIRITPSNNIKAILPSTNLEFRP